MITRDEIVKLEIERRSLLEVVRQFTMHTCDARMETSLDEFLSSLEDRVRDLQKQIDGALAQLVSAQL